MHLIKKQKLYLKKRGANRNPRAGDDNDLSGLWGRENKEMLVKKYKLPVIRQILGK